MPIPKVSLYQKLGKGAEGALHFARIMDQLLYADERERGREVFPSSDASGDYKGVDLISKENIPYTDRKIHIGYQYKFFPSPLSKNQRQEIKASLRKAIDKFPEMDNWVLVVPESFNKSDSEWFQKLAGEHSNPQRLGFLPHIVYSLPGDRKYIGISYIGHTAIMNMMMKHHTVGKLYYEEIAEGRRGELFLSKIGADTVNTNWVPIPEYNAYRIRPFYGEGKKSNELIFDFFFINNDDSIYHLHEINVIIEKVWKEMKGVSIDQILTSVGTIEFLLDFEEKINRIDLTKELGGPLVFQPKSSKRFNLHLLKFRENCPGNMAKLTFEFIFDSKRIISDTIGLDF